MQPEKSKIALPEMIFGNPAWDRISAISTLKCNLLPPGYRIEYFGLFLGTKSFVFTHYSYIKN